MQYNKRWQGKVHWSEIFFLYMDISNLSYRSLAMWELRGQIRSTTITEIFMASLKIKAMLTAQQKKKANIRFFISFQKV